MKTLNKIKSRRAQKAGFSLAELMVVIVIIGIIATLAMPNVPAMLRRAFGGTVKANITTISSSVENYQINNQGRCPESLEELVTPDSNGETYIKGRKVPKDPWGNEFQYDPPMPGSRGYRVYTYGKDGVPGGEGEDMDVDNWMLEDGEI